MDRTIAELVTRRNSLLEEKAFFHNCYRYATSSKEEAKAKATLEEINKEYHYVNNCIASKVTSFIMN